MKPIPIRFGDFIFLVVFISALASGAQMLGIDSDLGRHLALGNYILDQRSIPTRDIFSHTLRHESRPPYEWLTQVLFAIFYRALGLDGVILLTALLLGIATQIVYQYSSRTSGSVLTAFLVTLLVTASTSIHWLPRPHIVTFLILPIWVLNLEKVRGNKPISVSAFPILMILWANLHGGFIFGFLAFAAYSAGWIWDKWRGQAEARTGKRLLFIGIASLAASMITPDLWHNWEAVLNNRSTFILSRTAETMPPNFSDPASLPFVILLILSMFFAILNRQGIFPAHIFLLGGMGILAVLMARNIPLFSIVCAPYLSTWVATTISRIPAWIRIEARFANLGSAGNAVLAPLLITCLATGYFTYQHAQGKETYQFNSEIFPVQAVDWLAENPLGGRMFNQFNWGGYLLYRLWPRELVFVDSQSDFYGEALMRNYQSILDGDADSKLLLNEYQVEWVIVEAQSPLADLLSSDHGWVVVYRDNVAVIAARK
jgi:hypothetical protein